MHPDHKRVAMEQVQRYQAECESAARADEDLKAQMPDGFKEMVNFWTPHPRPRAPQLSDLGLQLEEVGFVSFLPKSERGRLRALVNAVTSSGRGGSRNGRYN
ncbi:MAG: hypothetical protein HY675_13405 [Chloroflexi bacterium]|nr:hypothetical protein [Chloroflexota bacterium]